MPLWNILPLCFLPTISDNDFPILAINSLLPDSIGVDVRTIGALILESPSVPEELALAFCPAGDGARFQ